MSSFLIKKVDKKKFKKMIINNDGYKFKPNITNSEIIISHITLYNESMIKTILVKRIEKNFKRVAKITYDVITSDDDSSTSDAIMALDEVARLRSIILNRYQKYLEKKLEEEYLKRLRLLENELRSKIALYQYANKFEESYEEQKEHGR